MPTLGWLQRGSERMKGSILTSEKLSVVVRVDLEGTQIQIAATGHVTTSNLHALYPIVQRTNSLADGRDVEMDLTGALIEPDALEQLQGYAMLHELPVRVDAVPADPGIVELPARAAPEIAGAGLAA
jgi:hypothetical protein